MNRPISIFRNASLACALAGMALVLVTEPVSARPPAAVTKAQSTATIFITVPLKVKPVSYVLDGKLWTARAQRGLGETITLPAAATNISLSRGAIITSSVPSADGGDAVKVDYTVTRPITLKSLTADEIRELGPYLMLGAVTFEASGKPVATTIGQAGEDEAPLLAAPKQTKAPDCEAIYSAVKKFVKDNPEKVLELVALQVGQHETCACEIVKAAIIASDADKELVMEIVETAIETAPSQFRIIGQCAIAVAPDALAEVQTIISKYGAVSADSGALRREMKGMVHIPAGHYPGPNGAPYKTRGFWIDAHEVTIGEYADFLQAITKLRDDRKYQHEGQALSKTSHKPDDWENLYTAAKQRGIWNQKKVDLNYPVVGVDWWDAYAYAQWRGRQLPTHEQWYAACSSGSDPAKLAAKGWKPVNLAEQTSHGIYGMAGNVSEWVREKAVNPADPSGPQRYMISGASYLKPEFGARALVWVQSRSLRRPDLGFRTYSDGRGQLANWGEKWSEKGDEKGGKGGAGGDTGAPFQQPLISPLPSAAINNLADAVDLLSTTTVNPFNVLDDIVTDSNARFVGSTKVRLPNPVRKRRVIPGGSTYDYYGSQYAMSNGNRAFGGIRQDDRGQDGDNNLGGSGYDTEKGGDYSDEKGGHSNNGEALSAVASVIGEVIDAGDIRLPSSGKIDILTAIAVAGGYGEQANRNECILRRYGTSTREAMKVNLRDIRSRKQPMIYVYEGDIVTIKKVRF